MPVTNFLRRVVGELETPRAKRPFGSGWLSGSIGLLAGVTALLMVIVLRYPSLTSMPDLAPIHQMLFFKPVLYFVLISGYILAILSMTLRRQKTLGAAAMFTVLLASLVGMLPVRHQLHIDGVFFGLDFFILNALFMGVLFVPLERLFARNKDQTVFRDEWREDLFYYLVSSLLVQILTYLTLAPSNFVNAQGALGSVRAWVHDLPWLVQLMAVMFLTDLAQYWVHRAFHRIPWLWKFHAVHHSAKSMDWIAGARMHFLEIIVLRSLTATPMFVLGFDESAIQTYILIVYVYSSFIHSNIGTSFGPVEKVLVSPRYHHWHHGLEKEAIDVNFAIHFPLLDRLFGTHHMPEGRWPNGYGIHGHPVPNGYWQQFLYPFRRG
ncbi:MULTISPECIES: sterol desaturase family protein [unclassified Mesorhizobium]|uniref:sterol desaturase family protein n=1 Tax=unclassified Mesorhizobium TaxID=325217 RepID=UPI0003CDE546|nr:MULTISPECIES: sterol desaturase family protein [unclassified Mesorhizobium]ESY15069.1 sterol desaturase [Mesorhizobium sp. LNJC395A00]WJI73360.1 sterol desaturase family protein [Mesorhizobium sp. C395A]